MQYVLPCFSLLIISSYFDYVNLFFWFCVWVTKLRKHLDHEGAVIQAPFTFQAFSPPFVTEGKSCYTELLSRLALGTGAGLGYNYWIC